MLFSLSEYLTQFHGGFNVFQYLTMRAILGVLTALVISLIVGWFTGIAALRRRWIGAAVFALFGLDRREEADAALAGAVERSPLVADSLLRARVARPEFHGAGISVGGPDEAWLYRDEMRATWKNTKGAMKWLKQTAGNITRR